MTRRASVTRPLGITLLALATTFGCKPWTIRPIDEGSQNAAGVPGRSDATAYVESIWTTRVLHEAKKLAVELGPGDVAGVLPSGTACFVRGTGTVLSVDRRSRVGLALVDLAPGDGRADVSIQIGPVFTGTALRDALPFIHFGDFADQLAFADVANALNARVLRSVLSGVEPASLEGRTVSFWGAAKPDEAASTRLPEVIPVILEGETK